MSIKLNLLLGFCCLLNVCSSNSIYKNNLVPLEFYKAEIVPDVLRTAPLDFVEAHYQSGKKALLGNELTPFQVKDQPFVSWPADNDDLYTLLLVHPDSPTREDPSDGEARVWLVTNIPGCDISKGQTVMEYSGSAPKKNSGYHRYVILVFKQAKRVETTEYINSTTGQGRFGKSTLQLISEWKLKTVAGNFYFAKWDKYAEKLREILGLPE